MSQLAVIVTSKEALSGVEGYPVVTREGTQFWVCIEPQGWVEATTSTYYSDKSKDIPRDLKLFESDEEIKAFLKRWKGHPWWCRPTGHYRTVTVKVKEKLVFDGYEIDN